MFCNIYKHFNFKKFLISLKINKLFDFNLFNKYYHKYILNYKFKKKKINIKK